MKFRLLFTAGLLLAGILNGAASGDVELNGLACLAGQRYAMLAISQPGRMSGSGFMLAEGETQFGVKLLAVDAATGHVEIEQDGARQSLRIGSSSASLPSAMLTLVREVRAASERIGKHSDFVPNSKEDLAEQYQILAGNPGWGTIPPLDSNSSQPEKTVSEPASANPAADPAPTLKDQTKEYWYQASMRIEQSRARNQNEVLSGEMAPWPRTPLTPPGTADNLVGRGTYFSNHIPGYVVPGYVNELPVN